VCTSGKLFFHNSESPKPHDTSWTVTSWNSKTLRFATCLPEVTVQEMMVQKLTFRKCWSGICRSRKCHVAIRGWWKNWSWVVELVMNRRSSRNPTLGMLFEWCHILKNRTKPNRIFLWNRILRLPRCCIKPSVTTIVTKLTFQVSTHLGHRSCLMADNQSFNQSIIINIEHNFSELRRLNCRWLVNNLELNALPPIF